jgi:hypothetical protein
VRRSGISTESAKKKQLADFLASIELNDRFRIALRLIGANFPL